MLRRLVGLGNLDAFLLLDLRRRRLQLLWLRRLWLVLRSLVRLWHLDADEQLRLRWRGNR